LFLHQSGVKSAGQGTEVQGDLRPH